MKAVILLAGIGSRIRPLTDDRPKGLVILNGKTILERMVGNIVECGITDFVMVTGYYEERVKKYVRARFPRLNITFVSNPRYEETNTGYSLLLAKDAVAGDEFVKFDGDVVFEKSVIEKLLTSSYRNCLCLDRNIHLAKEEVKAQIDKENKIIEVGKTIAAETASGESIGIEKLSAEGGRVLFDTLAELMKDPSHHKDYYDDSYTTLVQKGIPFHAVDITGLKWVEIDTHEDFQRATELFI